MGGDPLDAAKAALARFVASLDHDDRIALVAYDDAVRVLAKDAPPSEALARLVHGIQAGGSTDLYGGWLAGAKAVGAGGRVVLLSDGFANAGRYTGADDLARQAGVTYDRFRVATSTLGVGAAYDEEVMAGMARAGGGAHYFAPTPNSIVDALSRERHALGALALSHASLRYAGTTLPLNGLAGGETKRVVMPVEGLGGPPATLRATDLATGVTTTTALAMPPRFGHSDEATLEPVLADAARAEATAAAVRDPLAAGAARRAVRAVLLRLLAHPLTDEPLALAVRAGLGATLLRLEELETRYDEDAANLHRKRSHQSVHNLAERARAFSTYEEDAALVQSLARAAIAFEEDEPLVSTPQALALLPLARWAALPAFPLRIEGGRLLVAVPDPRDGFLLTEVGRAVGRKVRARAEPATAGEIAAALGV